MDKLSALFVAFLGVLAAMGIKYLISPKNKPSSPNELARTWLSYAVFLATAINFYNFFLWKHPLDVFGVWVIYIVILGIPAFVVGWLYGKFIKFRPSNTPNVEKLLTNHIINTSQSNKDSSDLFLSEPKKNSRSDTVEMAGGAENRLYELISSELESGNTDKGLWTKLFAKYDGDTNRTAAEYIKLRFNALSKDSKAVATSNLPTMDKDMVAKNAGFIDFNDLSNKAYQESPKACFTLAKMHLAGEFVSLNKTKAIQLLKLAASDGYEEANIELKKMIGAYITCQVCFTKHVSLAIKCNSCGRPFD